MSQRTNPNILVRGCILSDTDLSDWIYFIINTPLFMESRALNDQDPALSMFYGIT